MIVQHSVSVGGWVSVYDKKNVLITTVNTVAEAKHVIDELTEDERETPQ
jgi:hypothetical protein